MHHSQKTTVAGIILLAVVILSPSFARADGGTVRLSEVVGSYRISLFTSPAPFRAGPVDISVMLQDAANSTPISEARITLKMWPLDRPSEAIIQTASTTGATNKLMQAAVFELPEPGWWELHVIVEGPLGHAEAHCQVEAAEPWPHWFTLVPWIAWPLVPIALFGIHLLLVRRRSDCTA